jgi:CRP-like cAMP-binding protein
MAEPANRTTAFEPAGDGVLTRLSGHTRDLLLARAKRIEAPRGTTILRDGEDTPFLGVVEEGRVALRLRVPERGGRVTFATVEPGELLGWSALVAPFRSTADAVATEDCRLLVLDAADLRALLRDDPDVAADLLPIALEAVAYRLATSWHQLLDTFSARGFGPW